MYEYQLLSQGNAAVSSAVNYMREFGWVCLLYLTLLYLLDYLYVLYFTLLTLF